VRSADAGCVSATSPLLITAYAMLSDRPQSETSLDQFDHALCGGTSGLPTHQPLFGHSVRGPTGLKCGKTHALHVTLITAEMTAGMLFRRTADLGRDKDMPYKYEPRKGEVETVARVITRAMGLDPDEHAAPGSDIPLWHSYWQVARDALLAADGVRSRGA
jgi:hypothetical protein